MKGKVKFFHKIKAYGFIETDEGDFFFHVSEFDDYKPLQIDVGQEVEFEVAKDKGKNKAIKIKKIKGG